MSSPIIKVHVEDKTYVLFKRRLNTIRSTRFARAVKGDIQDSRVYIQGDDIYLDTDVQSWERCLQLMECDRELDSDLFLVEDTKLEKSRYRRLVEQMDGGGVDIVDPDVKIDREDDEACFEEMRRFIRANQGLFVSHAADDSPELETKRLATLSDDQSIDIDTTPLLSDDTEAVQRFFDNVQDKLKMDPHTAFKVINRLSTDENINRFIQNGVDQDNSEDDSSIDSIDLEKYEGSY